MDTQATIHAQRSQTGQGKVSDNGLEKRLERLEIEVALLRETLQKLLHACQDIGMRRHGYIWVASPDHLKGITDYDRIEAEELVYVHELADEDIHRRLEELEQWYHISSAEFYDRWQRGETDDIPDKIEWSVLYEDWLQLQTGSVHEGME